ncbi:MAG: S8 family serine peptidase [Gammaproteobacteria bacterium]|nr:S8 family serine peptidase [Gammaproteobacteria bacterium]
MKLKFLKLAFAILIVFTSACGKGTTDQPLNEENIKNFFDAPENTNIKQAIKDVFNVPALSLDQISKTEFDEEVVRTRIEVVFSSEIDVKQTNKVLQQLGATIISSIEGVPALIIEIPDPGNLANLDKLIEETEKLPQVRFIRKAYMPTLERLPSLSISIDEFSLEDFRHHLAVKFAPAWNADAAISAQPLFIVQDMFGNGPPSGNVSNANIIDNLEFNQEGLHSHGYNVLSIASSLHDFTSGGAMPGKINLRVLDLRQTANTTDANNTSKDNVNRLDNLSLDNYFLDLVASSYSGTTIVANFSLGWKCTNTGDSYCRDVTQTKQSAELWTQKIREKNLEDKFILATSAGNRKTPYYDKRDALTGSYWNYAALMTDMVDEFDQPMNPLRNSLIVENLRSTTSIPYQVRCLSENSFVTGNVSAIGTDVWMYDSPSGGSLEIGSGTSMASPQVAGLALYLVSINPDLTASQVVDIILGTAKPVPRETHSECSDALPANHIDAYNAILALDNADNTWVRQAILDVGDRQGNPTPDNNFDEFDVAFFAQAFQDAETIDQDEGLLDYSRHDLNGDSHTGGIRIAAFDLNYNGSDNDIITLQIGSESQRLSEQSLTDWDILCYYAYSDLYVSETNIDDYEISDLLAQKCIKAPAYFMIETEGYKPGTADYYDFNYLVEIEANGNVSLLQNWEHKYVSDMQTAWSADGKSFIRAFRHDGNNNQNQFVDSLVTFDIHSKAGATLSRVGKSSQNKDFAALSPDGSQAVLSVVNNDDSENTFRELQFWDTATGLHTNTLGHWPTAGGKFGRVLDWGNDGRLYIEMWELFEGAGSASSLHVVANGNIAPLGGTLNCDFLNRYYKRPKLSHDGKWLAIGCGHNDTLLEELLVINTTTGAPRQVYQGDSTGISGAAFSPDNKYIVFSDIHKQGGIQVYNLEDNQRSEVIPGTKIKSPLWGPQGEFIYYSEGDWVRRVNFSTLEIQDLLEIKDRFEILLSAPN